MRSRLLWRRMRRSRDWDLLRLLPQSSEKVCWVEIGDQDNSNIQRDRVVQVMVRRWSVQHMERVCV